MTENQKLREALQAYPTRYEIYDDIGELEASIEMFDAECSEINLKTRIHSPESFKELSAAILKCLKTMHPKEKV